MLLHKLEVDDDITPSDAMLVYVVRCSGHGAAPACQLDIYTIKTLLSRALMEVASTNKTSTVVEKDLRILGHSLTRIL